MLRAAFDNKVDHWGNFHQHLTASGRKACKTIPISNISHQPGPDADKILAITRTEIGNFAAHIQNFLLYAGVHIWTAPDYESLSRLLCRSENDIQKDIQENICTAGEYVRNFQTGNIPVIFLGLRTIEETREKKNFDYHELILLHEIGHMLDDLLGKFSSKPQFLEAYQRDTDMLSATDDHAMADFYRRLNSLPPHYTVLQSEIREARKKHSRLIECIEYYLPMPFSTNDFVIGASEAFAEIFAAQNLPYIRDADSIDGAEWKLLLPKTYEIVALADDKFKIEMQKITSQFEREREALSVTVIDMQQKLGYGT